MILLDYIANKGLRLPREGSSDAALWARVRDGRRASVGVGAVFPDAHADPIYDDHTPFLRAGIPAVDLIDLSYPLRRRARGHARQALAAQPRRRGRDGPRAPAQRADARG